VRHLRNALLTLGAFAAIAGGAWAGVKLAGADEQTAYATPVAASTRPRKVERVDLGREALALMPDGFTVHGAQNTEERRCFAGDEKHFEPCAEFMFDAAAMMSTRKRLVLARADELGWRHLGTDDGSDDSALEFARGSLRARIGLGPDADAVNLPTSNYMRVWDPSRRTLIVQPVTAKPSGDEADRRPFVAAANAACSRLSKRMRVLEKEKKPDPDQVLALLGREWNRLVAEIAALEPPPEDVRAVKSLLRELRNFARVLQLLPNAEGEQALVAVAGMVQQGQRAEKALAQFGLTACAGFTGVPPGDF
jgi:hypothetical protein